MKKENLKLNVITMVLVVVMAITLIHLSSLVTNIFAYEEPVSENTETVVTEVSPDVSILEESDEVVTSYLHIDDVILSKTEMDIITPYMDMETLFLIQEELGGSSTPTNYLKAYVAKDPAFEDVIKDVLGIYITE